MIGKIALALGAVAVWAGLGLVLVSSDTAKQVDAISDDARPALQSALDALTHANQTWLSAQLDAAQAAAAALATEKSSPAAAAAPLGRRNRLAALAPVPASQPTELLLSRAEAAVQRLSGAPLYAVVSAKGVVLGGTLWPDGQTVRAEPSVASAMRGVARVSFWHKDAQPFVLASAPIVEAGVAKGALVVARALGKETCSELQAATHVASFALFLAPGKPTCTIAGDTLSAGHTTPVVLVQANPPSPMFTDAARVGILAASRAFRPELWGSEIVAGVDLRPAFAALAATQQHRLLIHALLLIALLVFVLVMLWVLARPLDTLTNQLSLQLQQNDKHIALEERQFSGALQRLAKNINALAGRAPAKAGNTSVASMLGHTVDIPGVALPPKPATPAAPDRSGLFDDGDFEPTTTVQVSAILAKPPPAVSAPAPLPPAAAKPVFKAPPKAPFDSSDFEPTLISRSLPTDSLRFDAPLKAEPSQPLFDAFEAFEAKSNPAAEEKSLFGDGDDQRFSTLPELPANAPLSSLSGLEADSALSALQDTDARTTSSTPRAEPSAIVAAPPETPPAAGVSPWDAPPSADDPDMAHFQEVYDQFVRTRAQCGEAGELPLDRFIDKLKKSRDQVLQKQGAARVRFQVYVKDGKAALKAVAFR